MASESLPKTVTPTAARVRAIARDLAKQHKPKGERIDTACRRLAALADDIDCGVESVG